MLPLLMLMVCGSRKRPVSQLFGSTIKPEQARNVREKCGSSILQQRGMSLALRKVYYGKLPSSLKLLEAWAALTNVNHHRKVSILLNQWLALTMPRATGPWCSQCVINANQLFKDEQDFSPLKKVKLSVEQV